ncbi:hypothetical protein [Mycetocola spongiae]|uniref:hypothetical protein n=1 Tax=Mycetocola spongiae TaxID=2859226 RepID=UPI001CF5B11A|nr:hypothetical protein [Mycetocola spongiae]UCR89196.1 hypothetical protein KXZ72_00305 [Mycetocola spongiae]
MFRLWHREFLRTLGVWAGLIILTTLIAVGLIAFLTMLGDALQARANNLLDERAVRGIGGFTMLPLVILVGVALHAVRSTIRAIVVLLAESILRWRQAGLLSGQIALIIRGSIALSIALGTAAGWALSVPGTPLLSAPLRTLTPEVAALALAPRPAAVAATLLLLELCVLMGTAGLGTRLRSGRGTPESAATRSPARSRTRWLKTLLALLLLIGIGATMSTASESNLSMNALLSGLVLVFLLDCLGPWLYPALLRITAGPIPQGHSTVSYIAVRAARARVRATPGVLATGMVAGTIAGSVTGVTGIIRSLSHGTPTQPAEGPLMLVMFGVPIALGLAAAALGVYLRGGRAARDAQTLRRLGWGRGQIMAARLQESLGYVLAATALALICSIAATLVLWGGLAARGPIGAWVFDPRPVLLVALIHLVLCSAVVFLPEPDARESTRAARGG